MEHKTCKHGIEGGCSQCVYDNATASVSAEVPGYKAELRQVKARLYYLLLKLPEGELTDASPELDLMYALSRDKDIQDILQRAL